MTVKIAVLPGDGIGKEVTDWALRCLEATGFDAQYEHGDIGWELWKTRGEPLPRRTMDLLKRSDACLFGAITSKAPQDALDELDPQLRARGITYRSPILRIRQGFDLSINYRPCRHIPGLKGGIQGMDVDIFRENTEGLYSGIEFPTVDGELRSVLRDHPSFKRFNGNGPEDMAVSLRVITREGSRRILEAGFSHALDRGRTRVAVVEKPNVLRATGGLFIQVAREVAKNYPNIQVTELNVDAAAMMLVRDPTRFQVIIATNLFGDILSDIGGTLTGSLGMLPSASIGRDFALFEPVHGSAPDIAGHGIANPVGSILSAALMLDHFNQNDLADRIRNAVDLVVGGGAVLSRDLGGTASTGDVGRAVVAEIEGK